ARPPVPLTSEALEAGLNLRHLVTGDDGRQLAEALWRTGAAATLLAQLGSRRLLDRMEALDGLARARLPTTFAPVIRQITHPEPVVRLMAARAAARTLAEWSGPGRQEAIDAFARGIGMADLPSGAAAETMLLLEGNAPGVLSRLLTDEATPVSLLRAALDVVGRLRLGEFAYEAAVRISHRDPEVRAAALRALGRAGRVPVRARDSVVIALMDDT